MSGVFDALPGTRAVAVTPSDTADLSETPRALYVGTGGNVSMVGSNAAFNATPILWKNVPSGAIIPFRARRIYSTNTTAADILAIY